MQDDNTKKPEQSDKNVPAADKVEELPQKPISESDAQAVKGGAAIGAIKYAGKI